MCPHPKHPPFSPHGVKPEPMQPPGPPHPIGPKAGPPQQPPGSQLLGPTGPQLGPQLQPQPPGAFWGLPGPRPKPLPTGMPPQPWPQVRPPLQLANSASLSKGLPEAPLKHPAASGSPGEPRPQFGMSAPIPKGPGIASGFGAVGAAERGSCGFDGKKGGGPSSKEDSGGGPGLVRGQYPCGACVPFWFGGTCRPNMSSPTSCLS